MTDEHSDALKPHVPPTAADEMQRLLGVVQEQQSELNRLRQQLAAVEAERDRAVQAWQQIAERVEAQPGDGRDVWKPMDDAPRDQTLILAWCYAAEGGALFPAITWYNSHGWYEQGLDEYVTPLCWQPIDQLPAAIAAQRGGE